jgi:hypothetical protein
MYVNKVYISEIAFKVAYLLILVICRYYLYEVVCHAGERLIGLFFFYSLTGYYFLRLT